MVGLLGKGNGFARQLVRPVQAAHAAGGQLPQQPGLAAQPGGMVAAGALVAAVLLFLVPKLAFADVEEALIEEATLAAEGTTRVAD